MDLSTAGPWLPPWVVLGVLLAVVLGGLAAALVLRRRASRSVPMSGAPAPPPGWAEDDLPAFLESPPGSAARPAATAAGWPSLAPGPAPPPAPGAAAAPPAAAARRRAVVLAASALAILLVVTVAALVFPGRHGTPGPGRSGPPDRGTAGLAPPPAAPSPGEPGAGALADTTVRPGGHGGAARLEFGALVLEQRAVGVTATYPAVEVSWNGTQAVAHLRLPTYNCLADSAPADPVAAGCLNSGTEYADLPSPALTLSADDGTVRLSGRFPTYLRPNGTPPVWTGRVYEIAVRAAPADGAPDDGWVRAEGEIRLGSDRATTLDDPDVTVLRRP